MAPSLERSDPPAFRSAARLKERKMDIWFDGACEPNNPGGVASFGYVLKRENQVIEKGRGVAAVGDGSTNNVAEYTALIRGLEAAKKHLAQGEPVRILGDSQLVIRQLKGEYAVNAPLLKPLHAQAAALLVKTSALCELKWVRREENTEADKESKEAVVEAFRQDPSIAGRIKINFGKYAGRTLADVDDWYYNWLWNRFGIVPPRKAKAGSL